jgi:thioredoxin-related protein
MTPNIRRISIALCGSLIIASTASAQVHFRTATFSEAKKLAAKEHKSVMVDFYTSWCGWCKVLDRNTYSDENVGKIADAKFVSIKIDAEKGEGVALAKSYKITGYPTIVFFSADGNEIDRVVGYEDASSFSRSLELAAAGGSKAVLDELQAPDPPKDAKKWLIAANYYAQHNDRPKALDAFKKVVEYDPSDKLGQEEEAIYGVGFLSNDSTQWSMLESALQQFPKREEAQEATMVLIKHDFEMEHPDDAVRRIDRWAMTHPADGSTFNYFAWQAAEHSVVLDRAMDYAKRSIEIAPSNSEKAGYMDTKAEILFKRGNNSEASRVESDAIALLDPAKDKKLYVELTEQKLKFDNAASSGEAQPARQSNN